MALAVITGAATGIGLELARLCAADGHRLVLIDRDPRLAAVADALSAEALPFDLATLEGIDAVCAHLEREPVELLFLNAGRGLGHAFLDQSEDEILDVLDTNVIGTALLARRLGPGMVARGTGRILFTGSIAGTMPGTFQAVYNATKSFVNSLAVAMAHELRDSGVTVTCLMPGPTDTAFFERAGLLDTKVGQADKDDPAEVAKAGYDAMLKGREQVTPGLANKIQSTAAEILPAGVGAEMHRKMAEPRE
ncbi:SDR family NAD(P)-dependent oxidoreductase [Cereibacter azotoformans]|uniref:Short-subunit dehydrogenase n=2 Tax=Cereibacter TaxID=1653176 RepID=A0A2T5K9X5_9RHOB|nr:SDR family NAD(P)-dependent oxidoreductase [Cereibacter azotoformans]AXQ95354.1 SDR family NAD(P)-dependent oxidoreductase [Cereibacter sphaeroides]PTR19208.1 short-subunit dehydrogenase [Cereibacter azotoformans]UIJ32417.1 SDR family NAD(P)-dependent oxidoreductase [Cereibacter azotoformans]ULB11670.1 SDR family NAD(P)-dependent oxidoreductase [Cereibacter azotoformans]